MGGTTRALLLASHRHLAGRGSRSRFARVPCLSRRLQRPGWIRRRERPAGRAIQVWAQREAQTGLQKLRVSVLRATYEDMRRMEAVLQESDVNWISVRPRRLVKRTATGVYRLSTQPLPRGRKITYSALATALLDAIDREDLYRKVAFVAN